MSRTVKQRFTNVRTVYRAVFEFCGKQTKGVCYSYMLENEGPPVPGFLGVEECCASIGPTVNQHNLVAVLFHPYKARTHL